jgi:hypothetical protein
VTERKDGGPTPRLPRASLFRAEWDWRYFYFAKFRLANAMRVQIGWLVLIWRMPWLEHSARALHPTNPERQKGGA